MTYIPTSDAICPYCKNKLKKVPAGKTLCPSCKQFIYIRRINSTAYAVTETQKREIDEEKTRIYLAEKNEENVKRAQENMKRGFRTIAYTIGVISVAGLFILIALSEISRGWLWFLGVIFTIILLILFGNWGSDVFDAKQSKNGASWLYKSVYCISLGLAIGSTFIAVPVIQHTVHPTTRPEMPLEIDDLHLFTKNAKYLDPWSNCVGDGYMSGSITNLTAISRDYEIRFERWGPGWGYIETVGTIKVLGVQPGEKRSWECLLFPQKSCDSLYFNDWNIVVDGWGFFVDNHKS